MHWTRSLLSGVTLFGAVTLATSAVQLAATGVAQAAGCDTWYGPGGGASGATSGLWGVPSNWSSGIPTNTDDVCITVPGTYTVTLAPWSIGTADPNSNGGNVNSLTLGATTGAQTLDVVGQASISNSNETINNVFVNLVAPSTINATGTLILDSTNGGTPAGGTPPSGGSAALNTGSITNYGHVITQVEDTYSGKGTFIGASSFINEPGATLQVASGTLSEGNDVNTSSFTNLGTVTIAPGASMVVTPNSFSSTNFTNKSSVVNKGSLTVNTATWAQSAGSITGNTVIMESGSTLADAAGSAKFLMNYGTLTVTGTIPRGQTVTVLGEPYSYQGNVYNSTTASLGGTQVVNNGHLILEAPGTGHTSGGSVYLTDGVVVNNGTISAVVLDPAWSVHLQAGVTNHHAGSLSVAGGQLLQDNATKTVNGGHVSVAASASFVIEEGSTFSNSSSATTTVQIAGAKKFGQFGLAGPCCAGPGVFTARGTLTPVLVHGYKPAKGKDFPLFALEGGKFAGRFHSIARNFTADYKSEGASPAFVGAIYRAPARKVK